MGREEEIGRVKVAKGGRKVIRGEKVKEGLMTNDMIL